MRNRWIGITGLALVITALALSVAGPRVFAQAYGGGTGMMSGGMMSGMMGGGMMGGQITDDPNRPFDQQFLDQMIMHHQNAIMMAQHMIADSKRPELRDLAQRITTAQQREIDQMRQWRQSWYDAPSVSDTQARMMDQMMGGGMMSQEQMRQMMGADADFDRMFLQMMIPHHEAAVAMAEQALVQAEHPELKILAQTIITTQRAEITEMRGYLRDWYGANDP